MYLLAEECIKALPAANRHARIPEALVSHAAAFYDGTLLRILCQKVRLGRKANRGVKGIDGATGIGVKRLREN